MLEYFSTSGACRLFTPNAGSHPISQSRRPKPCTFPVCQDYHAIFNKYPSKGGFSDMSAVHTLISILCSLTWLTGKVSCVLLLSTRHAHLFKSRQESFLASCDASKTSFAPGSCALVKGSLKHAPVESSTSSKHSAFFLSHGVPPPYIMPHPPPIQSPSNRVCFETLSSPLSLPGMSLFFLFLFIGHALAFPSLLNPLSPSSKHIARRSAPPRSAILSAPKLENLPYWTTTLTVNGQKVTMMIDTGSADLYALAAIA